MMKLPWPNLELTLVGGTLSLPKGICAYQEVGVVLNCCLKLRRRPNKDQEDEKLSGFYGNLFWSGEL